MENIIFEGPSIEDIIEDDMKDSSFSEEILEDSSMSKPSTIKKDSKLKDRKTNNSLKKRILVVEDEAIIALNLKLDLENLGYDVVNTVTTGEDAISNAIEYRPDLTIMDIALAGDMDGIEAAEKILALDLPVIYLTANSDDATFNRVLNSSAAYSFIPKPYDVSTLFKNVEAAINRHAVEFEKINIVRGILEEGDSEEELFNNDNVSDNIDGLDNELDDYISQNDLEKQAKKEYLLFKRSKRQYSTTEITVNKILVVEDESVTALNLKSDLEMLGYDVVDVVDNGYDAVEKSKEHLPDFVLMDIYLKGEINGIEAAARISNMGIPIIFLTGSTNKDVTFESLKVVPYAHLSKPYSLKSLQRTLDLAIKNYKEDIEVLIKTEDLIEVDDENKVIEKTVLGIIIGIILVLVIGTCLTGYLQWVRWILVIPAILFIFFALCSAFNPSPVKPDFKPPFVSCIIPIRNEEDTIEETISSLVALDYYYDGKVNYEIIVCNDGSTDGTNDILVKFKEMFPNLRILNRVPSRSGKGKGIVLNEGFKVARGELIAVFDADSKVEPDFLNIMVPYLNDSNVQAVQSRIKITNEDENFLTKVQYIELACSSSINRAKDILAKAGFLMGNGQIVKRDAILKCGGWDEFSISSDSNLTVKLISEGFSIRYCDKTAVYQEAVSNWKDLFNQKSRLAIGSFETFFVYATKVFNLNTNIVKSLCAFEFVCYYWLYIFLFFGFLIFIIYVLFNSIFGITSIFGMHLYGLSHALILLILAFFAFFFGTAIALARDKVGILNNISGCIKYWFYGFHLIPLFFKSIHLMITRDKGVWIKTKHKFNTKNSLKKD